MKIVLYIVLAAALLLTSCSHPNQNVVKKETEPPVSDETFSSTTQATELPVSDETFSSTAQATEPSVETEPIKSDSEETKPALDYSYFQWKSVSTEELFDYKAYYDYMETVDVNALEGVGEPNPIRVMNVDALQPTVVLDGKMYSPNYVRLSITAMDIETLGHVNLLHCAPFQLKDGQANFGLDGAAYGWYTPTSKDICPEDFPKWIYDSVIKPDQPVLVIYYPSPYSVGSWMVIKEW